MKTKLLLTIAIICTIYLIFHLFWYGQDKNTLRGSSFPSDSNAVILTDIEHPSVIDSNTAVPNDGIIEYSPASDSNNATPDDTIIINNPPHPEEPVNIPPTEKEKEPVFIKIASWNIENWGKTKANDPERMRKIAEVIKAYDLIAVQEISNIKEQSDPGCPRNEDACPGGDNCGIIREALEKYLNEENDLDYEFVFSPHVKDERYLFIYNSKKIELEYAELVDDPEDSQPICDSSPINTGKMVRQPFMGKFRAWDFDFILLNVHTCPSKNLQELEGLAYFYEQILAEQAIRFVVIDRLVTQGTRSIKGRKSNERLWTVIATCALQGRSAFNFILEAVRASFHNQPSPSLLPGSS